MQSKSEYDIIVIGAGIAGASVAYELSENFRVLLLEMEDQPGYHSTGRSAAIYTELYGNPIVRKLAALSRSFLESPPDGFSEYPLLSDRGVLFIARKDQMEKLEEADRSFKETGGQAKVIQGQELYDLLPILKEDVIEAGIYDSRSKDIDVHSLHQGFFNGMKARGGALLTQAKVVALHTDSMGWHLETEKGNFHCEMVVNAAGAWADEIGEKAGAKKRELAPLKRTALLFDPGSAWSTEKWPMTLDVEEEFYFKPESGVILASPADEELVQPQDARAGDYAIALAIDRLERATKFNISKIQHKWAGLRSFVPSRTPIAGFDDEVSGFFWLAGQGGYGIKTAPAMAKYSASLLSKKPLPEPFLSMGMDETTLSPHRD